MGAATAQGDRNGAMAWAIFFPWRRRRLALGLIAFGALTATTVLVAYPHMFTGFAAYDDEGYMLIALKSFVNHGHLYDDVFSQYGPFYYEAWGGLFSLFGIPVEHDSGRMATMVAWILTALTLGLATWRITSRLLLGLAVQAVSFSALSALTVEPMHPGGIICLLLAAIVAVSTFWGRRESPFAVASLGGLVAALLLVKVNLGVFALASVALACVAVYPALSSRRWLRLLVEVGFVAVPFLLIRSGLSEEWARRYAVHVAAAALAAVLALRARDSDRRSDAEVRWLAGGFAVVLAVVCAAIVAAGTSVSGLVEGVIGQPLRQAGAFTIPLQLPSRSYGTDLLAVGGAVAYWYSGRRREGSPGAAWTALVSVFSIGIGVFLALSVTGKAMPFDSGGLGGYEISLLPFAWVALIAPAGPARPELSFARLLLPLLAVLQALHAYPVAGSQLFWSGFLLVPVGAVCVDNGVRGISATLTQSADRRALAIFGAVAVAVLLWFIGNATIREPLRDNRAAYNDGVVLGLPGAERIRLSQEEVDTYRDVSAWIRADCSALLMLPGMNSFYLWTEQEPPTGYNATGWPTLFDDAHQQRVIRETRSTRNLCLLKNIPLARFWDYGKVPRTPLVEYLSQGFEPLVKIHDYDLYRRVSPAGG